MANNMTKELSLSLRIPADKEYLENVILTLDGVCEHCNIDAHNSEKIRNALFTVLTRNIAIIPEYNKALFELNFGVIQDNINITIENYFINETEKVNNELKNIKSHLEFIYKLADNAKIIKVLNDKLIYSIQFNI